MYKLMLKKELFMKKSMVALFVLIVFTSATMYSAAYESEYDLYKNEAKTRRFKMLLHKARRNIACLQAENAELDELRVSGYHERAFAMLQLIQVKTELEREQVRRKAAEDEIARLQSLIPK